VSSDPLSKEDEQNREGKRRKSNGCDENEHVMNAHTGDPRANWKSSTRREEVAQKYHRDKGVIENLTLLVLVRCDLPR
jgi:hypothetical protein